MASRKKNSPGAARVQMPAGFKKADLRPKQLEIEPGFSMVGVLGAVTKSRKLDMPDYRTIADEADGVRYYLPSHAMLKPLMEMPVGQRVFIAVTGGSGVAGDPYDWTIGLPDGDHDEAVPF